ncbi:MAG: hypothetical protein FJZ93_04790 [Chloroflexi bacterium]|nr:hypothetical protein [Chloroflexota bacterium]
MYKAVFLIFSVVIIMLVAGCVGPLRTECYVGVKGQAASITVRGPLAGQTCSDIVAKQKWNPAQIEFYELDRPPSEPILCEYDISGLHVIVRDRGLIPAIGMLLCEYIRPKPQ